MMSFGTGFGSLGVMPPAEAMSGIPIVSLATIGSDAPLMESVPSTIEASSASVINAAVSAVCTAPLSASFGTGPGQLILGGQSPPKSGTVSGLDGPGWLICGGRSPSSSSKVG